MKKLAEPLLIIFKILFCIIITINLVEWTGVRAVKNIFTYHLSNYEKLNTLQDYIMCGVNLPNDKVKDYEYQYFLGKRCQELFKSENKRGGIYIQVENWLASSSFLRPEAQKETLTNPSHEFFFVNNFIKINNNYLKYNPITDVDGNIIDMTWAENEDKMYALVPQKYQQHEGNILKNFKEYYAWTYQMDRNVYLEEIGEPIEEVKEREVEIIYVKDNQSYINLAAEWGIVPLGEARINFVPDPIALIVNPINMGTDTYLGAFSTGSYKIRKIDDSTDLNAYTTLFEQAGMSGTDIYKLTDSYNFMVSRLYSKTLPFIFAIILSLVICFIQSKLYSKNIFDKKDVSILGILKKKAISFSFFAVSILAISYVLGYYISIALLVTALTILAETLLIYSNCKRAEKLKTLQNQQ